MISKKSKILVLAFTLVIIAVASIFLQTEWNSISGSKMAAIELVQRIGTATTIAEKCINQKKQLAHQCVELNTILIESEKNEQFFLMSEKDELIGVDFKNHVLIIFTPSTNGNGVQWQCNGKPYNALPKSCRLSK